MSIFSKPDDEKIALGSSNWEHGVLGNPLLSRRYRFWHTVGMFAVLPFLILLSWSEKEHFKARKERGDKYCK